MNTNLLDNIGEWIISHGRILSETNRSNEYTCVEVTEVHWRGKDYRIVNVDGMVCTIEHI